MVSGSGKSSLARAGLLAALQHGALPSSENWRYAICTPGSDPLGTLAMALCVAAGSRPSLNLVQRISTAMQHDERGLHRAVNIALRSNPSADRLVLLIDQFEEIFTLCRSELDRAALIGNLLYDLSMEDGAAIVLLTLRADFYGHCAAYPALAAALSDHQVLIGSMSRDELARAIELPAQLAGAEFEPGLVETLLADVQNQPGSLPLLQHALAELWERHSGRRLTHAAYQAIGGVAGALERRAERVYTAFTSDEQVICKHIFMRLVQPGEETEDTRRRATIGELLPVEGEPATVERVVQTLVDARLITTTSDPASGNERFVEVAHEALIRGWSRLQNWLAEEREKLIALSRLTRSAHEWENHGRDPSYLFRGNRLREIDQTGIAQMGDRLQREFLTASQDLYRAERRMQHQKRLLQFLAICLALLVVSMTGVAVWQLTRPPLWETVAMPFQNDVVTLATGEGARPIYYAGTANNGVYRSEDMKIWSVGHAGLPTAPVANPAGPVLGIYELAVDSTDPDHIMVSVNKSGIYQSWDGGKTFEASNTGIDPAFYSRNNANQLALYDIFMAAVFRSGSSAGKVYFSDDEGNHWEPVFIKTASGVVEEAYTVHIGHFEEETVLFVGTAHGLHFKSVSPMMDTSEDWHTVADVPAVVAMKQVVDNPDQLFIVAARDRDTYQAYFWEPGGKVISFGTIDADDNGEYLNISATSSVACILSITRQEVYMMIAGQDTTTVQDVPSTFAYSLLLITDPAESNFPPKLFVGTDEGLFRYRAALR